MIRRRLAAALAAALTLSAASVAAAQAPGPAYPPRPALGAPKAFSVPKSETYRLANGLQVTLIPYGLAPKATISLRVYAGNLNEGEDVWLPDLTGEMLKQGAAGRSAAQLAEAAASMGGGLNLGVTLHETVLSTSVLSESGPQAVRLLADIYRRPDFPAAELPRIKQDLARSLAVARSTPGSLAQAALAPAYYGASHPYGRPFPTDAQLAGYDPEDIRRFHAANFGARRARLYVAGRFDSAAMKTAIAQAFSDWAPGPERLSLPPQPRPGPRVVLVDRPNAPQSTLRLVFPAPVAGGEGDIDLRVTNGLLGGAFNSRITRNIRENKGYTYSPGSGVTRNAGEASWRFQADVTTDVTGLALKEVFSEIRRLGTEAPTETEAEGIRRYLAGTFVLQNASAGGLIDSIATRDFHGLPANWLDAYVPAVLDVSAAEMQASARRQFPLEKATLIVVGDLAKVTPQLQALPELQGVKFETVKPF